MDQTKIGCVAVVCDDDRQMFWGLDCAKGRGLILPGGKWEKGETFSETAVRELYEETNVMSYGLPRLIFSGLDESGYYCYSFLLGVQIEDLRSMEGYVSDEGEVRWIHRSQLLNSETFGGYYELMLDSLDRLY